MKRTVIVFFLLLCAISLWGQVPEFRFSGLRIYVGDLEEARRFYEGVLGFSVERAGSDLTIVDQSVEVSLSETVKTNSVNFPLSTRVGLSIEVPKLLPAIEKLKAQGIKLYDTLLARNGVGISIPFQDPFGNVLQQRAMPTCYNSGILGYNNLLQLQLPI